MNLIPTYRAGGGRSFQFLGAVLAGFVLLALPSISPGQVTVTTIGGGVRKECGNSYGFAAGSTYSKSQFHLPNATAVDSQGNLWIADLDNSDIEEVTHAGDTALSSTFEYVSGVNAHPFPGVIGVALDSSDNLYVLTGTTLSLYADAPGSFPDLNLQFALPLSMFVSPTAKASALTVVDDASTNIYICFTNASGGTIVRIPQPYSGTHVTLVNEFPFDPAGITMRSDGLLAVTDTRSNAIYLVAAASNSTPVLLTGGHGAGLMSGSPAFAAFNQPHGIAASGDGRMVVCDTMNNCVRIIDASTNTTTLYGTPANVWSTTCCSCKPARYAGWVDGEAGSASTNASSRQPVSVTISPGGDLFVTESYYNLLRLVTDTELTPVGPPTPPAPPGSLTNLPSIVTDNASAITATGGTLNASVVPGGSSVQVYFEWGTTTNYGSNTSPIEVSTNLAGTNLVSVPLTGLLVNTVIHFQAVAINSGGTSNGGDRTFITATASSISNQLGFTNSFSAGIGATAFLPIALQLQSGATVTSLQFRVEVTPMGGAPALSSLSLLQVTTNDFVQFIGPAPAGTPVNFTVTPYPSSSVPYTPVSTNGQGLLVFAGPQSGMSIQNFGVIGLLSFDIPYNATNGEAYSLDVLYPSGSAPDIEVMNETLTVSNAQYLAGDSSPATGYNAGEFGDGVLDNNDVNNAIFASLGLRVPPLYSDAFNAMDVYPQTAGVGGVDGDGVIGFLDWNTILIRSLGFASNWWRAWTDEAVLDGETTSNGLPGGPFISAVSSLPRSSPPGLVWFKQAAIGAGTVANLVPGGNCALPVYAKVRAGCSLSGLQFRAIVTPNGGAPPVGQVEFSPAFGIPSPMAFAGTAPNDILGAWSLGAFTTPLQNSNYIGTINFQIPSTAKAGQSYTVHFSGVDGAPDSTTAYSLESFAGCAWVLGNPLQPASITSDEWKLHFFGSLSSSLAGDNVDADGDGAPNWQEYLAGTDPTDAHSALKIGGAPFSTNGASGITLNWLTAPGKTYILQSISALGGKNWSSISTNSGDGYSYQINQNNYKGDAKFYRLLLQP